jgi:adenosine deaminase
MSNDYKEVLAQEVAFDAQALVELAKCALTDTDSIRALEMAADGSDGTPIAWRYAEREADSVWGRAHVAGRFRQMRRLHPALTDEAVENRIARALRRFQSAPSNSMLRRQRGIPASQSNGTLPVTRLPLPELLAQLAAVFLCEGRDGSIRVRTRHLSLWQDLILVVPPLLITAAFIAERVSPDQLMSSKFTDKQTLHKRISRWLCDSTLPVDDDPFLDHLSAVEGFDEAHMHLNGTTEAETIWCEALERPQQVIGRLLARPMTRDSGLSVAIGDGVVRLLLQEDSALTPDKLMQRTLDAIGLKAWLLQSVSAAQGNDFTHPTLLDRSITSVVTSYRTALETLPSAPSIGGISRVVSEAWQLAIIYQGITLSQLGSNKHVALWHYALLRAQFCRLLVQQAPHKGFDQFQYITLNELREETEKTYAERFRQIERGHQRGVAYVEGRFAPKASPAATADLIGQILRGYLEFLNEDADGCKQVRSVESYRSLADLLKTVRQREGVAAFDGAASHQESELTTRRLRLGLVPHFIKQSNSKEREAFFNATHLRAGCREAKLRVETDRRARALIALIEMTPGLETLIRGIDAASNERHAGPEVFAPTYRRMRRAGIARFTYHAGEDFAHLASGLRAMTEAVVFLELCAGCRLGHGTAAGLSPKRWWRTTGGTVVMAAEDRLDDLVVARELFLQERIASDQMPLIDAEIHRLAMRIWDNPRLTPDVLANAWKLRSLDPLVRASNRTDVDSHRQAEALLHLAANKSDPSVYAHFLRWHGVEASAAELRRAREEVVVSMDSDVLRPRELRLLQHAVLKLLHDRRIAIETLPSSNVRISIHEDYDDHHAGYWLGAKKKKVPVPVSVVVGSDDPGIFATGLRNEYAHLQNALESQSKDGRMDVRNVLHRVCAEAKLYRF